MKVEVKEAQSNEVDWTKNPQLVVGSRGEIVLTSLNQPVKMDNEHFYGTQLNLNDLGYLTTGWIKSYFKPFHGEITLKND